MWLTRSEEETSPEHGKSPDERSMEELVKSAVLVVDKNAGPTSHQMTAWVRGIFGIKLAGHSGTLDPNVTGVLPVAMQNATKVMPVLTGLDKEYVGVMHLHKEVPEDALRRVITERFIGKIRQLPPKKSAVARVEREREIGYFDILEVSGQDVLFKIGCEAGTYIRKVCHDVGIALGAGAHMTELRRTKVGNFTEADSHSLMDIRDAYEVWKQNGDEKGLKRFLIPVEHAILSTKKVFVKDSAIENVCNGAPVYVNGISKVQEGIVRGEIVAVFSLKSELVALGITRMDSEEMVGRKRGIAIRTDRVIMEKGTYKVVE